MWLGSMLCSTMCSTDHQKADAWQVSGPEPQGEALAQDEFIRPLQPKSCGPLIFFSTAQAIIILPQLFQLTTV